MHPQKLLPRLYTFLNRIISVTFLKDTISSTRFLRKRHLKHPVYYNEPYAFLTKVSFADVSPHLVFKNGINPTLWPQDMPFPPDEGKEEVASTYGDGDSQTDRAGCFSPNGIAGNLQYPAYFKDPKGMNHTVFGSAANFGALQYLKQQQGGKVSIVNFSCGKSN